MAPTFKHGKGAVFYFATGGSSASAVNLSSGTDTTDLERSVDKAETTTYGDNDKTYLAGLRDATIKYSGPFSSTHAKKIEAMLGNSTGGYFIFGPEGSASGSRKYKGSCIIESYKVGAPVGDRVSIEAGFQVTGAITSTSF